jgi:hypothetical protein
MEILLFLYGREDFGGGYAEAFLQMMSIMKQIFGTNVLKNAVYIYTNKMLYGIMLTQKNIGSIFDSMCAEEHVSFAY